jgi:hypothetical protein
MVPLEITVINLNAAKIFSPGTRQLFPGKLVGTYFIARILNGK